MCIVSLLIVGNPWLVTLLFPPLGYRTDIFAGRCVSLFDLIGHRKRGVTDSAFPTMHLGMLLLVFIPNLWEENTPIVDSVSVIDYPPPPPTLIKTKWLYSQSPVHVIWIHLFGDQKCVRNSWVHIMIWYIYVYFSFTYLFLAHKGVVWNWWGCW